MSNGKCQINLKCQMNKNKFENLELGIDLKLEIGHLSLDGQGSGLCRRRKELMGVLPYIISKNQRCGGYHEQNESYYHFLTPFRITSPPVKNRRAQIRPSISTKGLSGKLVNT